jgi:hypothetical protein
VVNPYPNGIVCGVCEREGKYWLALDLEEMKAHLVTHRPANKASDEGRGDVL